MFAFLYTIGIYLSTALARIVAFFHTKTRKWVTGQRSWPSAVSSQQSAIHDYRVGSGQSPATSHHPPILWFHAASLGEFEQGRPVIEAVRKHYPETKIVLTFFSPSGYEIRKDYDQVDLVCYLPTDTPANVKRFLDAIRPSMVLFIKYEFWYNYLHELKARQIPTILFSAIFRPNQLFFKGYGGFYRDMLFCFDHVLVQNRASEGLLKSIGYRNVTLAGDTRLDRVAHIAAQAKSYPEIEAFKGEAPLLIVGSAWPDDMEVLIPFLNQFTHPLKVIIAPHEINVEQIEKWQTQLQKTSLRFTVYGLQFTAGEEGKYNTFDTPNSDLDTTDPSLLTPHYLFLDTIGMLSSVYRYADFAYIGGAFGDGLHNILEPAVFGMPIFFGQPHYQKFQEAHDLLHFGGATTVANAQELEHTFIKVYESQELRQRKARICLRYVKQNAGATAKVMSVIEDKLSAYRQTK